MLVLKRRAGEYIIIGDSIIVRIIKNKDGYLRLAIEAPKDMPIWRGEVYEELQANRLELLDKPPFVS